MQRSIIIFSVLTRCQYHGNTVEIRQYKVWIVRTDHLAFRSGQSLRWTSRHIDYVPREMETRTGYSIIRSKMHECFVRVSYEYITTCIKKKKTRMCIYNSLDFRVQYILYLYEIMDFKVCIHTYNIRIFFYRIPFTIWIELFWEHWR